MKRLLLLLTLALGCGGQTANLTISIIVSPSDDPFAGAAQVRITVGDSMHVTTAPVSGGHFTVTYKRPPAMSDGSILVEALDTSGKVIAHGTTPPITLSSTQDQTVAVWVGRIGETQPAAAALPSGRSQIAAVNVPGLGAMLAGGADASGAPLADNQLYDVFTQTMIPTAPMSKARAAAAIAPVGNVHALVFGGATGGGMVDDSMELFDPTSGTMGTWSPVPLNNFPGRIEPGYTLLGSGNELISGGLDANGNPLASAALITSAGTVALTPIATPMAAARAGHAVTPAHFSDGDGAILFGGLPPGSSAPVCERLVNQTFSAYDTGMPNRRFATATTMASGDVIILGGLDDNGNPHADGFVIKPNVPTPTVTPLPMMMSDMRYGHTAMLTGGELIVCGGSNQPTGSDVANGATASCDVFDGTSYMLKRSFKLAAARTGHVAVVLDNGEAILAGGIGSDGKPLESVEIYTP